MLGKHLTNVLQPEPQFLFKSPHICFIHCRDGENEGVSGAETWGTSQ